MHEIKKLKIDFTCKLKSLIPPSDALHHICPHPLLMPYITFVIQALLLSYWFNKKAVTSPAGNSQTPCTYPFPSIPWRDHGGQDQPDQSPSPTAHIVLCPLSHQHDHLENAKSWEQSWILRMKMSSTHVKILQNRMYQYIAKRPHSTLQPAIATAVLSNNMHRPPIPPRVMVSSAMGLKLGVFRFLPTTHTKTNAKQMCPLTLCAVQHFTPCLSSCLDCNRCRWQTHLTNREYFDYGK